MRRLATDLLFLRSGAFHCFEHGRPATSKGKHRRYSVDSIRILATSMDIEQFSSGGILVAELTDTGVGDRWKSANFA